MPAARKAEAGEGLGGYDFTDSQGIHVSADHDWSLIGRVGFDLVDEMDKEKNTKLYLKASLLREFIDGYDVVAESLAQGGTVAGTYRTAGSRRGTWGVIGLGYSTVIGKNQTFYVDAERYVGNDFSRTYDIRAGINWKF